MIIAPNKKYFKQINPKLFEVMCVKCRDPLLSSTNEGEYICILCAVKYKYITVDEALEKIDQLIRYQRFK